MLVRKAEESDVVDLSDIAEIVPVLYAENPDHWCFIVQIVDYL